MTITYHINIKKSVRVAPLYLKWGMLKLWLLGLEYTSTAAWKHIQNQNKVAASDIEHISITI